MNQIICKLSNGDFSADINVPADLVYQLCMNQWLQNQGDANLLWKQKLTSESTVVEVGGYTGMWSSVIAQKHNPYLYILEPSGEFFAQLTSRFGRHPKATLLNYGLGKPGEYEFSVSGAGSSLFEPQNVEKKERVQLKSFDQFFEENHLKQIDLLQINIEGAEYELLEQITSSPYLSKIVKIQIQFHLNIENAPQARDALRAKLSKTHKEIFNYPFIWEAWELKEY